MDNLTQRGVKGFITHLTGILILFKQTNIVDFFAWMESMEAFR